MINAIKIWALIVLSGAVVLGQITGFGGFAGSGQGNTIQFAFHSDPPSQAATNRFSSSSRWRGTPSEEFYSRYILDQLAGVYFGYELLVQQQQPNTYLLTFGNLGLTPLEVSVLAPRRPTALQSARGAGHIDWTTRLITALPSQRTVHNGEVVHVDLGSYTEARVKLSDDVTVTTKGQSHPPPSALDRPIPTVSGGARDFVAADSEMIISLPRITFNGKLLEITPATARGGLVWLYIPDHGRYVFSLAQRQNLGFLKMGEIRGGTISFALGKDSIKIECPNMIAGGESAYHLYVLHDGDWRPTSQNQRGMVAIGSVAAAELVDLARK